jgi:probable rRNA maturation factor
MININNQQDFVVDTNQIKKDAECILKALNYSSFDLGVSLVNLGEMQKFNLDFRDKDKATDILSFPYHTDLIAGSRIDPQTEDDKNLGDVIICPQYVQDDLERWQKTFSERMQILLVHGICHLLGYDHIEDNDYEVMKKQEAALLAEIKK